MRVGVITRGIYGQRVVKTIKERTAMQALAADLPTLPPFMEYPEEFACGIDDRAFDVDLLINFALHPDLTPEIVTRAGRRGVGSVIIAGGLSKAGSMEELGRISRENDIFIEVCDTLCSLSGSEDEIIGEFTSMLGSPIFKITTKEGGVHEVEVVRGSPCGGSWWVAENLRGISVDDAPVKAGFFIQIYPCKASRGPGGKIHVAAGIHKKAVEDALTFTFRKT